eukprot:1294737-Rhodomonas_salina.6
MSSSPLALPGPPPPCSSAHTMRNCEKRTHGNPVQPVPEIWHRVIGFVCKFRGCIRGFNLGLCASARDSQHVSGSDTSVACPQART